MNATVNFRPEMEDESIGNQYSKRVGWDRKRTLFISCGKVLTGQAARLVLCVQLVFSFMFLRPFSLSFHLSLHPFRFTSKIAWMHLDTNKDTKNMFPRHLCEISIVDYQMLFVCQNVKIHILQTHLKVIFKSQKNVLKISLQFLKMSRHVEWWLMEKNLKNVCK